MKKLIKTLALPAMLVICIAQQSWAQPAGGAISGSVVDYNAAQIRDAGDLVTVPSGMITYSANSAIPVGAFIDVTLPKGFSFTQPSLPNLSSTDATFQLLTTSGNTARFVVLTSDAAATSTITLGSYSLKGVNALETVTPVAIALPLTMQVVGIDAKPLAFPEFASDTGVGAVFVGAIQFLDLSYPANGSKWGTGGANDSSTAVLSAIALSTQTVDDATQRVGILSPDGSPNKLASYDTANIEIPGVLYKNFTVFTDFSSDCKSPLSAGKVVSNDMIFLSVPFNREVFFCAKATGGKMIEMLGFPSSGFGGTGPGYATVHVLPSHPYDDYLASAGVNIEFAGVNCYTYSGFDESLGSCVDEYFNLLGPKN